MFVDSLGLTCYYICKEIASPNFTKGGLDLVFIEYEKADYCRCSKCSSVSTELTDLGFWLICCDCGKRVEDSFEYFNHYDGEDHVNDLY